MAKKKTFGVKFDGFAEMAARLDRMEGDLMASVNECLEIIPDMVNPELHKAMQKHRRTGRTEKAIVDDARVTTTGTRSTISVGFSISEGGLPSIFLMYGTARHAPQNQYGTPKKAGAKQTGMTADKKLYNAIFGNQINNKIAERQAEIFAAAVEKAEGGN